MCWCGQIGCDGNHEPKAKLGEPLDTAAEEATIHIPLPERIAEIAEEHVRAVMPACGNCRFWELYPSRGGICRRYAPKPAAHQFSWPITGAIDWCGEFEQKVTA